MLYDDTSSALNLFESTHSFSLSFSYTHTHTYANTHINPEVIEDGSKQMAQMTEVTHHSRVGGVFTGTSSGDRHADSDKICI